MECGFTRRPESAFGGVLITNASIDMQAATDINDLFFEVLIAPAFNEDALSVLKSKKNRILLQHKQNKSAHSTIKIMFKRNLNSGDR